MLFQKRHYGLFAKWVSGLERPLSPKEICNELITIFENDNDNFQPERFKEACGR